MLATGGTVPTLSDVRAWDTEHLTAAAAFWTKTATVWEDAFSDLAARISAPGGVPWEGEAAEAAQQLAYSDKMTVIGLADQLHSASGIARAGANEISEAKRLVLRVVDAAEGAGFTVGEDFSVTDPNLYDPVTAAARQAQAEALATDLRASVGTLMCADGTVAADLLAATGGLGENVFPESGDDGGIQLMGNRFKQDGPTPTPPPIPPEIQKRFDDQDAEIARQGKEIAEQKKQLEEQAASDGWSISGLGEAAAAGCAGAVGAVALGQFAMDPTKPPDEMNGALLAGTCTAGAATGGFVYTIGKAAKGIIEDIEDAIK